MTVYKLTLTSDNYLDKTKAPYRPELVEFVSRDQMDKYIQEEYAYCKDEYKKFSTAWTKEERETAFSDLVLARKMFKNKWFKVKESQEKDLA